MVGSFSVKLIRMLDLRRSCRGFRVDPFDERREDSFCRPALSVAAAAKEWEGDGE